MQRAVFATIVFPSFVFLISGGCGSGGPADGSRGPLHGKLFNERVNCAQINAGLAAPFCADQDEMGQLRFTSTAADAYQVVDVPDSGFTLNGTFNGQSFQWTATAIITPDRPRSYTEQGTWTFEADFKSFVGSSMYAFVDGFATGNCQTSGAEAPTTPAPTPAVPPCL